MIGSRKSDVITLYILQEEFQLLCHAVDDALGYMEDRCADTKYPERYTAYKQLWQKLTGVPYNNEVEEQPYFEKVGVIENDLYNRA